MTQQQLQKQFELNSEQQIQIQNLEKEIYGNDFEHNHKKRKISVEQKSVQTDCIDENQTQNQQSAETNFDEDDFFENLIRDDFLFE